MKSQSTHVVLCLIILMQIACSKACAGTPEIEADRCTRWLNAFIMNDTEKAATITAEQLRPGDIPQIWMDEQRNKLTKLHKLVVDVGGGEPHFSKALDDRVVQETGDIIKSQIWDFQNARAYVGCVSYPGIDNPWHLVVKFDDTSTKLIEDLKNATQSHLASPPTR